MAKLKGYDLVGKGLKDHGISQLFYLMGAPILGIIEAAMNQGIRAIDVRHEQAAAMMAHAAARVTGRPGVCVAASGPGTTNLITGVATAYVDGAPLIVLGGASPMARFHMEAFQELDQLSCMAPVTKWATRVYEARRIPEYIEMAFRHALSGKPGPVYLDLPGDVLYADVNPEQVVPTPPFQPPPPPAANPNAVTAAIALLHQARRPVMIVGSGALWSGAGTVSALLTEFAETTRIPVFPTPQGRGLLVDDHELIPAAARSHAFRQADVVLILGTRLNYMLGFGRERFAPDMKMVRVDIDPVAIAANRAPDLSLVGDVGEVLKQLLAAARPHRWEGREWVDDLRSRHAAKTKETAAWATDDSVPIHPRRLCMEVAKFLQRDAILAVDGHEVLNIARQTISTHVPGHRINAGPFGCMGVGVPFGIGAKVAKPDVQTVVLTGDGAFGLNGMELDTAARHRIPVLVVISNNAGWSARVGFKPGRELGHTRYDQMFVTCGVYGECVERPADIQPALARAARHMADTGKPACVNVITAPEAQAQTMRFTAYEL